MRYIDDLVVRDRDTTGDGTLDERLYSMQDANWNVASVSDASGAVQERYNYSAYGVPSFMTRTFTSLTASQFDWETLCLWLSTGRHNRILSRKKQDVLGLLWDYR